MTGPVPARVDGAAKARLLEVVAQATAAGWSTSRVCGVLEIDRRRVWRWQTRAKSGTLTDTPPGRHPVHGLLAEEDAAIIALFEAWGPVDLSHRKLAHRGSYLGVVWASPSTVDRVLTRSGLSLRGAKRPPASEKAPWPEWAAWRRNQLWGWDMSQFGRCTTAGYAYGILDLVTRKRIATILAAEATSTQGRVLFVKALEAEGLCDDALFERLAALDDTAPDTDDGFLFQDAGSFVAELRSFLG